MVAEQAFFVEEHWKLAAKKEATLIDYLKVLAAPAGLDVAASYSNSASADVTIRYLPPGGMLPITTRPSRTLLSEIIATR